MPDAAPLVRKLEAVIAVAGAGAAQDQVVGEAPFAGTVSDVSIVPEAALTADNTNNRTFRLINKGQTGGGTTVVASYQSNVAGGNLVAFDEKALTLSATPANLVTVDGDILAVDEIVAGTGVAHSGYKAQVEITRA